jgi:hypothetical protein
VNIGSGDAVLSDVVMSEKVAFMTFDANLHGDMLIGLRSIWHPSEEQAEGNRQ